MNLQDFINQLQEAPENIEFTDTIAVIEANYNFSPSAFINGGTQNAAEENQGSCKLFAFGQLNSLNQEAMLACFGKFYRNDVLQHPENNDHQNIRNFMVHGWAGIHFDSAPLAAK